MNAERRGVRIALAILLVVYLALLAWVVLFKLHEPFIGRDDMRGIKLVPFVAGDGFGASDPLEVLGNAAAFVPLGVYLAALTRWRLGALAAVIAGISLAFEVTQYALALGSTDVTDVLVNTSGGLVGVAIVGVLRRAAPARAAGLVVVGGVALTLVAAVVVGAVVTTFPRMPEPGSGPVIVE